GTVTTAMKSDAASFQGGDFAGITKNIEEGYFDRLGVNALWISAPYEQIQGYCCSGNGKSSFPHYSYHGYYAGDYSQIDQNFGTADEFQVLVDTAHSHNIRIVLDIVMNHPGYNTMYDMNKFGYAILNDGWEDEYYAFKGDNNTYHKYITYTDANRKEELTEAWGKWWGNNWIRAELSGYGGFGPGDILGSAGGELPDFKTESTEEVSIPEFLQNKWTQEGVYDNTMEEMNSWFAANNKPKTVRNYLCYWLSRYVEKYGVDGFRCDTAKHVEREAWAELKDVCSISLENWRKANPDKPGADWDENFWMTAEVYGKTLSGANDEYFKVGKFDSTINFAFTGGNGLSVVSAINDTYQKYAENINTSDNYNLLTYISSHDTALCGRDKRSTAYDAEKLIYQGSALQLMPGGVQIFYGDETGRPYVRDSISSVQSIIAAGNHDVRSFMNWDEIDNDILAHWQKVGTFRNRHISVGAGEHKTLSTSSDGAAFARYYDKNSVKDKVLCYIGGSANTSVSITVDSELFPDGTILKNCYDDTEAMVYHGKVKFNSGINGTILCEVVGTGAPIQVESVEIKNAVETIKVGETTAFSAIVTPDNATESDVVWSSSDESVATVDVEGKITAVGPGTTTITAEADGKSATVSLTVLQDVTAVSLNAKTKVLYTGSTYQLKATVKPENASNKAIQWTSSNKNVATVSQTGKVTAKAKGTAVITATATDGSGVYGKCTITVKQRVTKIKLSKTTVKLKKKGTSAKIKATALPKNANVKTMTVIVENKKIAKINKTKISSGKAVTIKAKKRGKTKVIFTASDGSKKKAVCKIKVLK
ncbi:MAG: Ig-like domain-containing protein, partial [Oscillospiraceae bacterium]|nr:Ig-like domain-containing protein [Oscillospiraceae bacterium]